MSPGQTENSVRAKSHAGTQAFPGCELEELMVRLSFHGDYLYIPVGTFDLSNDYYVSFMKPVLSHLIKVSCCQRLNVSLRHIL